MNIRTTPNVSIHNPHHIILYRNTNSKLVLNYLHAQEEKRRDI